MILFLNRGYTKKESTSRTRKVLQWSSWSIPCTKLENKKLDGMKQEQWPLCKNNKLSLWHNKKLECQFKQICLRFSANNEFYLNIDSKTKIFKRSKLKYCFIIFKFFCPTY